MILSPEITFSVFIRRKIFLTRSCSLLPGKSHGWRSLEGCSPWGGWELDTTERLHFHFSLSCIGEGNGNPLQCSCLENPRDGVVWWAAVFGVAQSQTRLKWLSSSSSRLLCPWNSPSKNTRVGCHSLLQIFLTQDGTRVSCIAGRFFTVWATREALFSLRCHLFPSNDGKWGYNSHTNSRIP